MIKITKTKKIKAYAVLLNKKIAIDDYREYTFMREEHKLPAQGFVITESKFQAKKWINQWNSLDESQIIPIEITYPSK